MYRCTQEPRTFPLGSFFIPAQITPAPARLRLRTIVRSYPWAGEAKPVSPLPEWRQKKSEPAEADPDKARSRTNLCLF